MRKANGRTGHREQLDALAGALLTSESLDQQEILRVTGLSAQPPQEVWTSLPRQAPAVSVEGVPPLAV